MLMLMLTMEIALVDNILDIVTLTVTVTVRSPTKDSHQVLL